MPCKPKILIVAFENWTAIARLPKALQRAGFEVAAICPANSYLATTQYLDHISRFNAHCAETEVTRLLHKTLRDWKAQMIVPGDERTIFYFHKLIEADREGALLEGALETMVFSFGNLEWHSEAVSKRLTLERANWLRIKTPRSVRPKSPGHAIHCANQFGWPVVLKKSSGFAGNGVRFCKNERELTDAYHEFDDVWQGPLMPGLNPFRTEKLWWKQRSLSDDSFTVNEAIRGTPAAVAVVAVNGKVLGQSAALKVRCHPEFKSPSSVMRFVHDAGMFEAAEKLVRHWGATGFIAFDFIVDDSATTYLLECNPRPTPLSCLSAEFGCDLCLCFGHYFSGETIPSPSAPRHEFIANFPNEWLRDPESPYLRDAYHDVPWDDPALLYKLVADSKKVQTQGIGYRSLKGVRRYLSELRETCMTGRPREKALT
jgi:Carbamoyl-phosphate synthase L chain, ATP binding domain